MRTVACGSHGSRTRELAALVNVMTRFWLVVLPLARGELRRWRQLAEAIPDPELREQALATLEQERLSAAGAALFATTAPRRRDAELVRALVAYQVICDYLDTLAEQPSPDPIDNGVRLHRALADAVAAERRPADWYARHRAHGDGGYLAALVTACRESCATLPAFAAVREAAAREAARNEVQGINHAPAGVREPALRAWALAAGDEDTGATWFELAAASSSSLAVLALLAAAADPQTSAETAERVRRAYFPWVGALSTLLDSVADRDSDLLTGELSFVSQYASRELAVARLRELTACALAGARSLPRAEQHVVLVAGMIAMHVTEPGAWLQWAQPATRAVLQAADTALMPVLLLVLRSWRQLRPARRPPEGASPPQAATVPDAVTRAS